MHGVPGSLNRTKFSLAIGRQGQSAVPMIQKRLCRLVDSGAAQMFTTAKSNQLLELYTLSIKILVGPSDPNYRSSR